MGRRFKTICIISLLFIIFISCGEDKSVESSTNEINKIKSLPDSEIYDFSYKYTVGSKLRWELFSEKAEIYTKDDIIKVTGVHLTFYNNKGEIDTGLDSKYGMVHNNTKIMTAISNVVLRTATGSILYTDILNWDDNIQKLYTDGRVKIVKDTGDVITGIGFEADNKLEKIVIKRSVKGKIYEKK